MTPTERCAYLRQQGLYSSHLCGWRKLRDGGILDGVRKRGRKGKDPLLVENERLKRRLARAEQQLRQAEASPNQVIATHDEQRLLLQALRTIPLDYQVILELIYWESMTAAEAAAVLSLPLGTAKTRIRRGRQLVEHELRALEGGSPLAENTCTNLDVWARQLRGALVGNQ